MRDPHIDKLAHLIVHYSTKVKKDELVRIQGEASATPLLEALYDHVLRAGAHPHLVVTLDSCRDILLQDGTKEQLCYENPISIADANAIDVSIGLWADTNTKSDSLVNPMRSQWLGQGQKNIRRIKSQRAAADGSSGIKPMRWVGMLWPSLASAQDAEMSLREFENFVFKAGALHLDDPVAYWESAAQKQQLVVEYLTGKKEMHFNAANGTDLHIDIANMRWMNCCGHRNFPDGEVFTGPNLNGFGVEGIVRYSFPAVAGGHEVHDIELHFEKGKVVHASASKGEAYLLAMLDQDKGARFAGEIALGTNYHLQNYSKNTLLDEKIGGTFHLAVGAGYPDTGNCNESALHWDMVCDMRPDAGGGTIEVDGEIIQKDGRFINASWPSP